MCFSPEVSFTASAVIALIGVATLRKVDNVKEILFASIPMIFATQQFVEGLLWLVLLEGMVGIVKIVLTQIYAGFVGLVWPLVVPFSILMIERGECRKKLLMSLFMLGCVIAVYSVYVMTTGGVESSIKNSCIKYDYPLPQENYMKWVYVFTVSIPFFFSGQPMLHKIGVINLIMFFISYYVYSETYVSVWCFFAAAISGLIYFYFRSRRKDEIPIVLHDTGEKSLVKFYSQILKKVAYES